MFTVRGEVEFKATSGTVKLPVGLGGTATPPMLVTMIDGWAVDVGEEQVDGCCEVLSSSDRAGEGALRAAELSTAGTAEEANKTSAQCTSGDVSDSVGPK
jgi:hypothetical protein